MTSVNDPLGFAKLIPGFDFMQQFAQAATSQGASARFADWIAPTLSVEELDKRIADLKAVQFWLEQNTHALRATVQALEVQKMTLSALQGMNLNMADMAKAFTVPMPSAPTARAPEPERPAAPDAEAAHAPHTPVAEPAEPADESPPEASEKSPRKPAPGMPDPLQWWGALTQQFQSIAANALRETARAVPPVRAGRAKPARPSAGASARRKSAAAGSAARSAQTGAKSAREPARPSASKSAAKATGKQAARPKPSARGSAA